MKGPESSYTGDIQVLEVLFWALEIGSMAGQLLSRLELFSP